MEKVWNIEIENMQTNEIYEIDENILNNSLEKRHFCKDILIPVLNILAQKNNNYPSFKICSYRDEKNKIIKIQII